jgi:DNA-directed RNA polymerase subunit M/transcription elongation factor TFIIS
MKSYGIYKVIENDEELLNLYKNDAIFKKSIDCGYHQEWSNEKTLMFTLKKGYEAKNIQEKEHLDYILHDSRPIQFETTNVCPKCKNSEIFYFENGAIARLQRS